MISFTATMVQENSYKKKEWSEGGEGGAAHGEDAQTSISFEKRSVCIIEMVKCDGYILTE